MRSYRESPSIERMRRIDDRDGLNQLLAVQTTRGIKKLPRSCAACRPVGYKRRSARAEAGSTWRRLLEHDQELPQRGRIEVGRHADDPAAAQDDFERCGGGAHAHGEGRWAGRRRGCRRRVAGDAAPARQRVAVAAAPAQARRAAAAKSRTTAPPGPAGRRRPGCSGRSVATAAGAAAKSVLCCDRAAAA